MILLDYEHAREWLALVLCKRLLCTEVKAAFELLAKWKSITPGGSVARET